MRSARTSYLESWNSVVNTLVDNSGSSGLSRANTITKFSLGDRGGRDTLAYVIMNYPLTKVVSLNTFKKRNKCTNRNHCSVTVHFLLLFVMTWYGEFYFPWLANRSSLVCPLYVVYLAKQKADLKCSWHYALVDTARTLRPSQQEVEAAIAQIFL